MVEKHLGDKIPGDKPGSWLVPIDPRYFRSPVTPVYPNPELVFSVKFEARRNGEEPFLKITATGDKTPAQCAHVVIYEHELLGSEAESDAVYEVVSILASPTPEQTPTDPITMMRNYLERPGGTKAAYTADDFAKSILFWSHHVMVAPPDRKSLDADPMRLFFEYAHLPANMHAVARLFCELADSIIEHLPMGLERTEPLKKLLEARDATVKAFLATSKVSGCLP